MKRLVPTRLLFLPLMLILLSVPAAWAGLRLPALFSDHMVLQRDVRIPVWGKADPGDTITVSLSTEVAVVQADASGNWKARFDPLPAGGPFVLSVKDGKETQTFHDVLIGEVWVCSGQSNMEWPLKYAQNGDREVDRADHPRVRLFLVGKKVSTKPEWDVEGKWRICSPDSAEDFSAVGYFYGLYLHNTLDVPVGLIESAWGGTTAEAWTSREDLLAHSELRPIIERFDKEQPHYKEDLAKYKKEESEWAKSVKLEDTGVSSKASGWMKSDLDDSSWLSMRLPGVWSQRGLNIDGAVWFRKRVQIPESWVGKDLQLSLGAIDDYDRTYVNGMEVGHTGKETPISWLAQRVYKVPASVAKGDTLTIAVRVFDTGGEGGFSSRPDLMLVQREGQTDSQTVSLAGTWKYRIERQVAEKGGRARAHRPRKPIGPNDPNSPGGLYRGMILPLVPYAIRGVIWYQGESNASRAYQYRTLFPVMIRNWRRIWDEGDFPFLFVQLAAFAGRSPQPTEHAWAELREAQTMALSLPNTAMAVTIDIGAANTIHPRNKQEVGRRLELAALAKVYGRKVEYSGPLYRSMKIEGNSIHLSFDHVGGGLRIGNPTASSPNPRKEVSTAKKAGLEGFAVAGKDRKFVWAVARIDGDTIVVSSPEVSHPVAVRYGWDGNPACNLFNDAGFPASPFRTDDWPGLTVNAR